MLVCSLITIFYILRRLETDFLSGTGIVQRLRIALSTRFIKYVFPEILLEKDLYVLTNTELRILSLRLATI